MVFPRRGKRDSRPGHGRAAWRTLRRVLALFLIGVPAGASPSVREYGAAGDGNTDDTEAFVKAFRAGRDIYVPPGEYLIGNVLLPEGTYLHGAGDASRIVLKNAAAAVTVTARCTVSHLFLTSRDKYRPEGGENQANAVLKVISAQRVHIDRICIEDCADTGIYLDHAEDVQITNSHFEKLDFAVLPLFCRRLRIQGNRIVDTRGIQFWGYHTPSPEKLSSDVIFANNYVKNARAAIWTMGVKRVVMTGNIVDGAGDIGLDAEWAEDVTIVGNTVRDCQNAAIACFVGCTNVAIVGNSIVITDGRQGRRNGIWLTHIVTRFPFDKGHRNVTISGNTIVAEGSARHGVYIASGENVLCHGNVLENADVFDRTGQAQILDGGGATGAASSETLADTMTVVPLSQEWRFRTDPDDEGTRLRWDRPELNDDDWAVVRSDKEYGWERQGFPGYTGAAWYRAALPELPQRVRSFAYLYFDAVDEQAWVYLNGNHVGAHTVESTGRAIVALWDEPFSVEISSHLNLDATNVLAVRVHNAQRMGGIWKGVYLVFSDTPASLGLQATAIHRLANSSTDKSSSAPTTITD